MDKVAVSFNAGSSSLKIGVSGWATAGRSVWEVVLPVTSQDSAFDPLAETRPLIFRQDRDRRGTGFASRRLHRP